jgi:hypothetical protein
MTKPNFSPEPNHTLQCSIISPESLSDLSEAQIDQSSAKEVVTLYCSSKDQYIRGLCLKLLYSKEYVFLEQFFASAFKRERYLDTKLYCVRGLAQFWSESRLVPLLKKLNDALILRAKTTPFNYQEYEILLGKNALPFLVSRYGYDSFKETLSIVKANYDDMPDAFKGHFTIDEHGKPVLFKTPEESKKCLADFWASFNAGTY